jgi:hypothetical protein
MQHKYLLALANKKKKDIQIIEDIKEKQNYNITLSHIYLLVLVKRNKLFIKFIRLFI